MCIAISENTMWGYWWVKERIKSMRLKTSGFLEKQGICTWKTEQMEDKTQIFQFTLLCIILFCSTNWRFMKGRIIMRYDMIWYDMTDMNIASVHDGTALLVAWTRWWFFVSPWSDWHWSSSSGLWMWTFDGLVAPVEGMGVAQPGYIIWAFPVCLLVCTAGFTTQLNRQDLWTPQSR